MASNIFELVAFLVLSLDNPLPLSAFAKYLDYSSTRWVQPLYTDHELSSTERKNLSHDSNPGQLGEKRKRYLCAMPPHSFVTSIYWLVQSIK